MTIGERISATGSGNSGDILPVKLCYCESEGLLTPNNGNEETGASSFGFTDRLSGTCPAKLKDLWKWTETEETVAVSPAMFREFFLPYFAGASAKMGRIYYGCCEPLQNTLPSILQAIPHVGKVSVSPWSNQRRVAEIIGGKGTFFPANPLPPIWGWGKRWMKTQGESLFGKRCRSQGIVLLKLS